MNRDKADARAVILDMDGVIVDSEPCHERAILEVLDEIGFRENHGLRLAEYIGRSDREVWIDFIERSRPPQTLEELLARKRQRTVDILRREQPLFAGVDRFLERLAGRYLLGLASGSERPVVDAVLDIQNLRRWFPVIVTGSEIQRGKPAPDIFLKAAELLTVRPRDCWVIEDSKPGIAAARAAGMRVIALTHTHPAGELTGADSVVGSFAEIGELLC